MLPRRGILATQQWTEQSLQHNLPKPSCEVQMHALWSRDLVDYKDKLWFKKDGPEVHSKQKTPCRDYNCPTSTMAAVLLGVSGNKIHFVLRKQWPVSPSSTTKFSIRARTTTTAAQEMWHDSSVTSLTETKARQPSAQVCVLSIICKEKSEAFLNPWSRHPPPIPNKNKQKIRMRWFDTTI